mmetsp:Transcript_29893/g.49614  ORF Transcript_29893/g.49614 Transcript_29893/m.49614 type:complete len:821 (+) Transcript_29893:461-2923(+)
MDNSALEEWLLQREAERQAQRGTSMGNRSFTPTRQDDSSITTLDRTGNVVMAYNNRDRIKQSYWKDGEILSEDYKYNDKTIELPVVPPKEGDITVRTTVWAESANRIRGYDAPWAWKVDVLERRFSKVCPSSRFAAEVSIPDIKDRCSPCYEYTNVEFFGHNPLSTEPLKVLDTITNDFLPDMQENIFYISATLTFSPKMARVEGDMVDASKLSESSSGRIFIRYPRNKGVVVPGLHYDHVTENLKDILKRDPHPLEMASSYTTQTSQTYHKWIEELRLQAIYEAMTQVVQYRYVGAITSSDSLHRRLCKLQQVYQDSNRTQYYDPVSVLCNKFMKLVREAKDHSELPELDRTFYQALNSDFQDDDDLNDLISHEPSKTIAENISFLEKFSKAAQRKEKTVTKIGKIASRQVKKVQRHNAHGYQYAADDQTLPQTDAELYAAGVDPPLDEQVQHCYQVISAAEQAIRQASGTRAPIKCWGCSGIHDDCNHQFKDCPYKFEPAVQQQRLKNLREYQRKQRDPNYYKRDGFPSKKAVTLFNTLNDDDLSAEQRAQRLRDFVAEFHTSGSETSPLSLDSNMTPSMVTEQHNPKKRVRLPEGPVLYFTTEDKTPKIFSFNGEKQERVYYPMANEMPHIAIPFGNLKQGIVRITGLLDTGGCSSIGHLDYFMQVAKVYPHLVGRIITLKDLRKEDITIGGIGGRIAITHIMELQLPYCYGESGNSKHYHKAVGLTKDLPITFIIGLPFQKSCRAVIDHDADRVYSKLFNDHWDILPRVPTLKSLDSVCPSDTSKPETSIIPARTQVPITAAAKAIGSVVLSDGQE